MFQILKGVIKIKVDLSNVALYKDIPFQDVAGAKVYRLTQKDVDKFGENFSEFLQNIVETGEVILTGVCPRPFFAIAFHLVVHRFKKIKYIEPTMMAEVIVAQHIYEGE